MIPVRDTAPSWYPPIMMWMLIGINVVVFVITYEVAKKMGLNASDQMPAEILELMDLNPQPVAPNRASRICPHADEPVKRPSPAR